MLLNKKKRKKFSKKYVLLENLIYDFLNWKNVQFAEKHFHSKKKKKKLISFLEKIRIKDLDSLIFNKNDKTLVTLSSSFALPTSRFSYSLKNRFYKSNEENESSEKKRKENFYSNNSNFFINFFQINPGSFFPQKKIFMQYWIFPLIGFVGLTWNKNSATGILDSCPKIFNENTIIIKNENNANTIPESVKYSFTFPITDQPKEKKLIVDFYVYYFLAKHELEQKLLTLNTASPESTKFLIKESQAYNKSSIKLKNQFYLSNNKNKILKSNILNFEPKICSTHFNFSKNLSFTYNLKEIYEKNPKKLFPISFALLLDTPNKGVKGSESNTNKNSNPKTIVLDKMKRNTQFSIIEIPNTFSIQSINLKQKKVLQNHPIHSYEKAKILLDNAMKYFLLKTTPNTIDKKFQEKSGLNLEKKQYLKNTKNLVFTKNLENLKNQSYFIKKNMAKSKLLINFSILKNSQNKAIYIKEFSNSFVPNFINNGKIKRSIEQAVLAETKGVNNVSAESEWIIAKDKEERGKSNKNFVKAITKKLKFDLDKILFLKKLKTNLINTIHFNKINIKKNKDIHLKFQMLDSNLKNTNKIIKNLNFQKKNRPSIEWINNRKTKTQNLLKDSIYELSVLKNWRKLLNIFLLNNNKICFDKDFSKSMLYSYTVKKNEEKLLKIEGFFNKFAKVQKLLIKFNDRQKNVRIKNQIYSNYIVALKSSLLNNNKREVIDLLNKTKLMFTKVQKKNNSLFSFLETTPIKLKTPIITSGFSYNTKSFNKYVSRYYRLTDGYLYSYNINSKENSINKNFYSKKNKTLGRFMLKSIISKMNEFNNLNIVHSNKKQIVFKNFSKNKFEIIHNLEKSSKNFILNFKDIWFNLQNFYKKFYLKFLQHLYDILYKNLYNKTNTLESNIFYKPFDILKNSNKRKKLIKKKKNLKVFKSNLNSFNSNLKKNKKEKIFRTLLSYKFSIFGLSDSPNIAQKKPMKRAEENLNKNKNNEKQYLKKLKEASQILKKNYKNIKLKKNLLKLKKRIRHLLSKNIQYKYYKKNIFSLFRVSRLSFSARSSVKKSEIIYNNKKINQRKKFKNKVSLNRILRRVGFVFLSEFKIKPISGKFNQLKQRESQLVKEKFLQKKRRRKKLKLETRRRKKRKRFYPRPIWLRYSLYKNFLNFRHSYNNFYKKQVKSNYNSTKNQILSSQVLEKNTKIFNLSHFFKNQKLKNKIYRNNKQKWGNFIQDTPKFEKISLKKINFLPHFPIFQNKEYYKVSNRILSEFQPLCWKSYWLRSNLTPYMNRIQKNFSFMKQVEKTNNINNINAFLYKILGFFSYDFYSFKFKMLPFYSDFKNSFDNQNAFYISNLFFQESTNKIAEYNRIEFERFSEILKNVKFNMNLEGQLKPKSYKFIAWKYLLSTRELKALNKKNFWYRLSYNVQPNFSSISPFVIFSNSFSKNSASIKPYGSSGTLRALWAFNKTNIFTFKEKNQIRDIWEITKLREQLKSNQTRKFLMNLIKVKNNLDLFSDSIFHSLPTHQRYEKSESMKAVDHQKVKDFSLALDSSNRRKNNHEKTLVLEQSKLLDSKKYKNLKNLSYMNFSTLKKLQTTQKKIVLISLFQQKPQKKNFGRNKQKNISYNYYIRFLKSQISSAKFNKKPKNFGFLYSKNKKQDSKTLVKPRLLKPSSYFWWSSKNFQIPFNLNTFNKSYMSDSKKTSIFSNKFIFYNIFIFSILFHFSILFSFIRIPELRGLLKFQILLFYKISNNYFIILYSIYDLLKKYKSETFKTYKIFLEKTYKLFSYINILENNFQSNLASNNRDLKLPKILGFSNRLSVIRESLTTEKNKKKNVLNFYFYNKTNYKQKPQFSYYYFLYNVSLYKNLRNKKYSYYTVNNFLSTNNLNLKLKNREQKIQKQLTGTINYPKIYNKDFKSYYKSNVRSINFLKSSTTYITSQTPFIYSFSSNIIQFIYTKKIFTYITNFIKNNKKKIRKSDFILDIKQNLIISFYKKFIANISVQTQLALFLLYLSNISVRLSIGLFESSYQFLLKIIDLFESLLLVLYKFLEKPAELMIEWIAQFFLIEWSSDASTFIPETFDMYFWYSFQKFSRNSRILGFIEFQNSTSIYNMMNSDKILSFLPPLLSKNLKTGEGKNIQSNYYNNEIFNLEKTLSTSVLSFSISNILGFFMQRRLWNFFHLFIDSMLKPDIDLIVRQKKGKIFWDIWADILIRAAEQYNINIPSLTSLKEEQEKLIERLIQDPAFINFSVVLDSEKINNSLISNINQYNIGTKILRIQNLKRDKISNNYKNVLKNFYKTKSWSSNQYITFNLKDTDLFLDISPPKSLLNVQILNYEPIQYTLGSIMCEIYSGLFYNKVSKNLLIVNSKIKSDFSYQSSLNTESSYGSLIIQALAGESEMKMMIDNANRYASNIRGVAVGMKLLKDVFESIVLQTPCFFLIEDLHVIGERRPMLISDDENSSMQFPIFGFEQDEESEKNQMIYQSSRHSINDFRRPYKGDFSMTIPTNLYNKNLYSFKKFSKNSKPTHQKKYPILIPSNNESVSIKKEKNYMSENSNIDSTISQSFISRLQIASESFFAPPATSPFTILMMKEQKKFKPKKVVKQISWNSFVAENITTGPETIRVKVAILADMTLRNFSYNKDMITDLLVIIDGVRSNRGFVVFATTHLPSILDPALRRPGRFDETISLPLLPNLMNRWSLMRLHFDQETLQKKRSKESFDRFDYGILTENWNFSQISNLISKTKLSCNINYNNEFYKIIVKNFLIKDFVLKAPSQFSTIARQKQTFLQFANRFLEKNPIIHPSQTLQSFFIEKDLKIIYNKANSKQQSRNNKQIYSTISFGYFQIGKQMVVSDLLKDQSYFSLYNKSLILEQSYIPVYQTIYSSIPAFKFFVQRLLGGKIAEFFVSKNTRNFYDSFNKKNENLLINNNNNIKTRSNILEKITKFYNIDHMIRYKSWHFATSLIFSILQKRFLYNKNLIITKMLSFDNPNQSSLREAPSPPASSLLMPSKKYENFKRIERDFQQKSTFSIYEKIQMHQKQRFLKRLYNKPIFESFKSKNKNSNILEFTLNQKSNLNASSSYSYYKNRLNTRHRFSLINQWWNGQLAEHNVEVTYLSDIDWRTMYIQSNAKQHNVSINKMEVLQPSYKKLGLKQSKSIFSHSTVLNKTDSILDFPDADQHYNPRVRRWFLNANTGFNYWLNFENTFYYEIYSQILTESFNKTSLYFNANRELLDYFVYIYNVKGSLKENHLIFIYSRFYRK